MNHRRYLELALIAVIVGVVALALKIRLDDIQRESRRVQLLMAAETARSNAALLQLRCPDLADRACEQRALSQLRRASAKAASPLEPASAAQPGSHGAALDRLQAIASAAGLAQHDGGAPQWQLRVLDPHSLEVALSAVTDCRFVLRWHAKAGTASIEDIHPRC